MTQPQSQQPPRPQRLRVARELCAARGLEPGRDAEEVLELALSDTDLWPECCEGCCEPCTLDLQAAARELSRLLSSPST